ncbi:MAG: hypothetical protein CVU00_15595 [Bacteroidetes bacterium HGW-Bacteroidetes-17]|nr:MAG: hypothetical protein CVU00_15595 [Bacteroidetes bacterium HGW-Bacteroidetes-17]
MSRKFLLLTTLVLVISVFIVSAVNGQNITKPEEYLGFKPGADFHLANYEQAIGYFEKIAGQTNRMQIFDMGETSEGRRMKYAIISSEENMANLEKYRLINEKLTMSRGISKAEAEKLAEEGKAIVWIDCGLHATEASPAQHALQLAYDMVSGEDQKTKSIRENVIFLLVFANPDGLTMVADWYMKNVGTKYEKARLPELYQKYAGHDNNRDSYIANLKEIQNMNRVTCQIWFPEILYNLHETAPFPARIWLPPESEPMNPNVHPIIVRWKNLIGSAMGKSFAEEEKPGAISRVNFDSWYPGYATQFVDGHNIPSILTETANFGFATPNFYSISDFPEGFRDLTPGVFYPNPWEGGWWRLGDAVAYNLTASKAVLETASKYKNEFLYNKWKMASDVIQKFQAEPPYGWIIPAEQRDENSTALMINRFILNGIEIYSAEEAFEHNGIKYSKGSYIIPTSQPFGYFVKNIMELQKYPDLKKYSHLWQGVVGTVKTTKDPIRSYDAAGWTLPLQMGVKYKEISKPLEVKKTKITEATATKGSIKQSGAHYVLSHADNGSYIAVNRILKAGGKVGYAQKAFSLGGANYEAGTFTVEAGSISAQKLKDIVSETNVTLVGGKVPVEMTPYKKARVALYKSYRASMDEGWISLILDRYEFDYHQLLDAEVIAGELNERFDVIILPDMRENALVEGMPRMSTLPDFVGGITNQGADNLKTFVKNGGVLICNNSSADFAIKQFEIPITSAIKGVNPTDFNCPGSILKMNYNTSHKTAFGMKSNGVAYVEGDATYIMVPDTIRSGNDAGKAPVSTDPEQKKDAKGPYKLVEKEMKYKVIASYPDESLLLSGMIFGEDLIKKKATILDVPVDKGNIILFGFNFHNRAQSYATFKLLFNNLYK